MRYCGAHRAAWAVLGAMLAGAGPARADAVMLWNNDFLTAAMDTSIILNNGPPEIANQMAQLDTAMFNAVNAASGLPYNGYDYTGGAVANASVDAAALAAGYTVLSSIFNAATWTTALAAAVTGGELNNSTVSISGLENQINTEYGIVTSLLNTDYSNAYNALKSTTNITVFNNGIALGIQQADDILGLRANDGSVTAIINGLNNNAPVGSGTVPGVYVPPSASGGRPEMFPEWNLVQPWALTPAQLAANIAGLPGPPALNSPAYATALMEVECAGSATALPAAIQTACNNAGYPPETTAQANAALFWNDPGSTFTPPGHWLSITDTVLAAANVGELQEARLSAMLSTAESDAGTAAWTVKYQDNLWRPVTAINNGGVACPTGAVWNTNFTTCDPGWSSLIATPPHPDYVAGHPAFSGAGAAVLFSFFGTNNIAFCSDSQAYLNAGSPVPVIQECFNSFSDAGISAEFSRVAGGIHTPFSVEDAFQLGCVIGSEAAQNAAFQPVGSPVLPASVSSGASCLPEPPSLLLFVPALAMAGWVRRRRSIQVASRQMPLAAVA